MLIQQIEGHMLYANKVFTIFHNFYDICQCFLYRLIRFDQINPIKVRDFLVNLIKVFNALLMLVYGHLNPGIYSFE